MIANSFGVNMNHYVHQISLNTDTEINIGVLYIPGCSFKMHFENLDNSIKAYEYYENGELKTSGVSIYDILMLRKWDYVTLQQVSSDSGKYDTYFPYIDSVIEYVRKYIFDFKFVFHETWAYKEDTWHPSFIDYNSDACLMLSKIKEVYSRLKEKYSFEIIRSGEVIALLKEKTNYNYYQDDGYHLNDLGEYAVGLGLVHKVLGLEKVNKLHVPNGLNETELKEIETIISSEYKLLSK